METTQARKQPRPAAYDVEDDDVFYTARMPSSARRYRSSPPAQKDVEPVTQKGTLIQRRSSLSPQNTTDIALDTIVPRKMEVNRRSKHFPLLAVLIGMVITLLLLVGFSVLGSWWQTFQDDLHYGRPRTSQLDAVVGHGDSASHPTHFIFLNLHRHVEVIEIPGGDIAQTRLFTGPVLFGDGQDLTPITGEIRNSGNDKPDLIVHIQNQQIIYHNDGTTFHAQ